ncbi:uncharacterized protein F5Z01DRAFT_203251 [Emericellopsis atlantica]|uniref:Uncharacterized protein n=1 Tax=Emericellopsis atlantica TaxID=2614577 RepID=A0A9P7ZUI4_9HYPO|nr:uncharacterized protein F5Z01DRAFT_203251 [Emericellopsis atlantica]KAG9258594.1 hypothetical protein F5Z01DRAFT_203251 [Emericellopsis atlantica]
MAGVNMEDIEFRETNLDRIAKSWSLAMGYSHERIQKVHDLTDEEMRHAANEGHVVLETVCLFIHSSIKRAQFKLPCDFWSILLHEFGIVVYPSAMTEAVDLHGVNVDKTFTDCYHGHIVMLGRRRSNGPPPCPFEYLRQPPPVYKKNTSDEEGSDTDETDSGIGCEKCCDGCAQD